MADTTNNADTDIILEIDVKYEDAIAGIAKYNQNIQDLRKLNAEIKKDNAELTKQFKEKTISETAYNKAIENNNKAIETNNVLIARNNEGTRALRKEIQNNIKIENSRRNSVEQYQAQLSKLRAEYKKLGDEEVKDIQRKQEIAAEIDIVQAKYNNANNDLKQFYTNTGNYENAIKNALGINSEFANSFLNLAKSSSTGEKSVKSFFTNAGASVQAFGKALLGLLTNPVFLAIAGIVGVGVAFKFWYDYNKGLEEATRLTKQFTGLAGNELKAYRNEIQGVADAYNKDFKDVLEASNAVAKQFGITQQEALQYVKDGFIAGADANGEYLSTLKEYPAYFKEAGISASEFIAITAETSNQGIFSDKGIDAIKEANIRLREMNTSTASALDGIGISSKQIQKDLQSGATTTFEVMQKVSEKLNEYPEQSKQVGTAIADIFGGAGEDAGLQYLKTLKDIDTNLDEVKKKSGELGEIQERQMNANIELQNAVSALFDQTGGTFETLIGNAKVFATESLTSIVKGVIDVVNWFINLYNNSTTLRAAISSLTMTFKTLFEIASIGFKSMIEAFRTIGKIITAFFTSDFKSLPNIINEATSTITDNIAQSLATISKDAKQAIEDIRDGSIKPIEIPVNVVSKSEGTDAETKGGKSGLTEEMKKRIEAEKKAAVELAKFRLEIDIKNQKDIANNQDKSYDDRLNALNKYFNLQKAFIEKDKEYQLSQKGLTESQIALIKEKSNQKQIELEKELADKSLQIMKDEEARRTDVLNIDIQNRLSIIKQGSNEELALRLQQLEIQRQVEIDAAEKTGADKAAINAKYFALEQQERQKQIDFINSQAQTEYRNQILQAQLNNQNTLAIQIAAKQAEITALTQLENESDVDYLNRQLMLQNQLKQLEDDLFQYQVDNQIKYMQAVSTIAGGFEELFSSIAEDNESFAEFAKSIALFKIGLDTATALTAGIAQAQSVPFPANLAAIATTVATILSNIAKAKKYLSSEKQPKAPSFATGGLVNGLGSGTSDSISARLSNGESVLTARATSLFSPVLSAFNQIGGGVPISTQDTASQIMGEEMLSRAFSRAVQNLPNPIVSVQEIDSVNSRISALESSRSL